MNDTTQAITELTAIRAAIREYWSEAEHAGEEGTTEDLELYLEVLGFDREGIELAMDDQPQDDTQVTAPTACERNLVAGNEVTPCRERATARITYRDEDAPQDETVSYCAEHAEAFHKDANRMPWVTVVSTTTP